MSPSHCLCHIPSILFAATFDVILFHSLQVAHSLLYCGKRDCTFGHKCCLYPEKHWDGKARVSDQEGLCCRGWAWMIRDSLGIQLWLLMHVLENNTGLCYGFHGEVIFRCCNYLHNCLQNGETVFSIYFVWSFMVLFKAIGCDRYRNVWFFLFQLV